MARLDMARLRATATSTEARALLIAAIALVVGAGLGFLFIGGESVPISGRGSLGSTAALVAGGLTLVVFTVGYLLPGPGAARRIHPDRSRFRLVLDTVALAVAHASITLLLLLVAASTLQDAFIDAVVFPVSAALLVGVAASLAGYFTYLSASGMTTSHLATVFALYLLLGVVTSMLFASDPHWWKSNLSALGMHQDFSSVTFNVTLIIGGIIITAISSYLTAELEAGSLTQAPSDGDVVPARRRIRSIRTTFILLGIFLACVGFFPVSWNELVHVFFATGLLVIFFQLVIRIHRLVPGLSRTFITTGYVFIAVVAGATAFYFLGYYNLTAVEIIGFVIIFAWLIIFIRNISARSVDAAMEGLTPRG